MNIYKYFDIDFMKKEMISFVGGGGKTSSIFKLAKELKDRNKKVLVTTSTAIYYPNEGEYDELIIDKSIDLSDINKDKIKEGSITVIGREVSKENKLLGLSKESIDEIYNLEVFDYILVEADGSKRKAIKAPADHEPVIPFNTYKVVGVIGLDCIKKKINMENVHRPELFCNITNSKMEEIIDEDKIFKLIINKKGLFKATPENCKKYILLNKVEVEERKKIALQIRDLVIKSKFEVMGIIACSIINKNIVFKWSDKI
ncbi:selenium cofactor biosynthesis protein YqeC [Tepidibacter hydrothermalis]|uniref:Selenium cofactor biosynthesis protein YqeC n=1 Tax=Tepidibacter hydrothermalis TaxID=3036126 RepID=A0ABY8E9W3_9FIRM|nr:selenium cofactor biosynthesis protein YqeC [Tepidibacter hydrothermalis]WFD09697.1 selenium cofactor biosynthesis protein YqeC [Tepidibacter hydrothermalis]